MPFLNPTTLIYLTLLSLILIPPTSQQQWYQKGNPHFINQQQFNKLVTNQQTRNKGVTILKFFTPWCRYCKYLKDIIDHLMKESKWAITVLQVNCDQQNYMFCGNMGVQSFPKMIVFEDGQWRENMDGFYPLEVVREMFKRYNRTTVEETKKEENKVEEKVVQNQKKEEAPKQINPKPTLREEPPRLDEVKPKVQQKDNFIEPQVIKPSQQPKQPQQPKAQQQPKQQQPKQQSTQQTQHQPQQAKQQQPNPTQPQAPTQPQPTQPHPTPLRQPSNSHKPQQFIQQQQNIAVIDQDLTQTQHEKKIVQQAQKQKHQGVQTIDLTKTIHEHIVSGNYGKYFIYAVCVIVGGYYFMMIMKGDANGNTSQGKLSQSKSPSSKNINISRHQQQPTSAQNHPRTHNIQDFQLSQQLHFQHPNQQQANINQVQIQDEDL